MAHPSRGPGVNLEVFVTQSVRQIHDLASSRQHKQLRATCQGLLDSLGGSHATLQPGDPILPPPLCQELVSMLQAACSSGAPSIVDPALGTLHKLVAHAFLQGESSSSGRGDDGTIVTQVVTMVARTGVSTTPAVQLGMVRALLTAVTAEHFVPHGDCLMQAVRAVFNLAIGSSDPGIQATAKSALLQMLNTVLKRVDHQVMTPMGVSPGGPAPTLHRRMSTPTSQASLPTPYPYPPALESVDEEGAPAPQSGADAVPPRADGEGAGPRSGDESTEPGEQQRVPGSEVSPASGRPSSDRADHAEEGAEWRDDPATLEAAALAWGERVASASESREAAAPGAPAPSPPGSPSAADLRQSELAPIATPTAAIELHSRSMAREDIRTAQMATMAEQADLRGLERALEELPASGPRPGDEGRSKAETPPDPRRALMHSRRASAWRLLTTIERDAITVLGAMCKLGARETSWGAVETVLHEGKLLALELLTRVLCDPLHDWLGVRPEFAGELRAPLCLVLLRNCMSPFDEAVRAAVRLLCALAAAPRLRAGLRAELGALYPLLLLRPLEAARPESVFQAEAALEGLLPICSSPQILVDVFVNYDCSLQASNLYERSIKALGRMASLTGSEGFGPPAATKRLKEAALKALLAVVSSLDTWAGPIKSRAITDSVDEEAEASGEASPERAASLRPALVEELDRIVADKLMKATLQTGIDDFNANPIKGMRRLVESGLVGPSALEVAAFLREHGPRLKKEALGEYFGHHEEFEMTVMHEFIAAQAFTEMTLDAALRQLLVDFRLPGEAQKIDRIMEAFAARYCACNPNAFPTTDGAYLLSFAIIMLNTDAHNPMADRRISEDDFVTMAMYQTEGGDFAPIAPEPDLRALYRRILAQELAGGAGSGTDDGAGGGVVDAPRRKGGPGGAGATAGAQRPAAAAGPGAHVRLAAALGLGQLVAPLWPGAAAWDKAHGVDVERRRLASLTREVVAAGGTAGNLWHSATHAEHARPMLQAGAAPLAAGLAAALADAASPPEVARALAGLERAAALAALLSVPELLEELCAVLARGAGLEGGAEDGASRVAGASLPPPGSPAEAKQVACLACLLKVATCPEATYFGAVWIVLLRALSALDALLARLAPPAGDAAAAAAAGDAGPGSLSSKFWAALGWPAAEDGTATQAADGAAAGAGRGAAPTSGPAHPAVRLAAASPLLSPGAAPGAGLLLWHDASGATAVDRVFSRSPRLTGDGVVDFVRALCAAGAEELGTPGCPPRLHLLQRLTEVALLNVPRPRLVWARLWAMASAHLVSAACHADEGVGLVALDALRQLTGRLLARREAARAAPHAGEALRPFLAVLRLSDSERVRELAVACLGAAAQHGALAGGGGGGAGLGAEGWRAVLAALELGVADPGARVAAAAREALQPALEALWAGEGGHALLEDGAACVLAAVHGARAGGGARAEREDDAVAALYLAEPLARRLACAGPRDEAHAWRAALRPLGILASDSAGGRVPVAALGLALDLLRSHARELGPGPEAWGAAWEAALAPALRVPSPGVGGEDAELLARLATRAGVAAAGLAALLPEAWALGARHLFGPVVAQTAAHAAVPALAEAALRRAAALARACQARMAGPDWDAVAGLFEGALARPAAAPAALAAQAAASEVLERAGPPPAVALRLLSALAASVRAARRRAEGDGEGGDGDRVGYSAGVGDGIGGDGAGVGDIESSGTTSNVGMHPARQLVEGGALLLQCLGRVMTKAPGLGRGGAAALDGLAATCRVMAAEACLWILEDAAAGVEKAEARDGGAAGTVAWPDTYTEALTLEALSTWLRLGEPTWGAEHTRAWPALCTLLRSRSEAVRGALRGMMAAQLAVVAPEVKARENGAKASGTSRPPAHA
ncbi:hypothetical protein ACKKBG_A38045 [Auxenochlorella protothecoides x Auxenochlorella symbiontica]